MLVYSIFRHYFNTRCTSWRTFDGLRYQVFQPSSHCLYYLYSIFSRVDTGYTTCWNWENKAKNGVHALISTYRCPSTPPPWPLLLFFLHFPFYLALFSPFINQALSVRFLSSGTLMCVAGRMMLFIFPLSFFFNSCISSFLLYYVRIDGISLWVMR